MAGGRRRKARPRRAGLVAHLKGCRGLEADLPAARQQNPVNRHQDLLAVALGQNDLTVAHRRARAAAATVPGRRGTSGERAKNTAPPDSGRPFRPPADRPLGIGITKPAIAWPAFLAVGLHSCP